MDEVEILKATLNNTIQRNVRTMQNYEIEIANLTAEIVRLSAELDAIQQAKPEKSAKPSPA